MFDVFVVDVWAAEEAWDSVDVACFKQAPHLMVFNFNLVVFCRNVQC